MKTKLLLTILIGLICLGRADSQTYQSAFNLGGAGDDKGYSIALDGFANVYVTGNFYGTVDFDPGAGTANLTGIGNQDIFVAKYTSSGAYQWAFRLGSGSDDYGYGIALDSSANVYVTGYFAGTADFDPGAGIANLSSTGSRDIFVAKYTSAGNYQWAFNIGASTLMSSGYSITVDDSANVYVTGFFQSTADFDPGAGTAYLSAASRDIFVAKYTSSGAYQWAFKVGTGSDDYGYEIVLDSSANVYVTGYFQGTTDFDTGAGIANLAQVGGTDIFVAKYTSSGIYQWAFAVGSGTTDAGFSIALDGSANVYITGDFSGTADFDPGVGVANLNSTGSYDIFIAKYNSSGAYQWAFKVGSTLSDAGNSIALDGSSNVYVIGGFSGTADFDPGAGVTNLTPSGLADLFVAKYTSAGVYQWAFNVGGTGNDFGRGIALDDSCNIYITGDFLVTADFDPGAGTANLTSAGNADFFVAKYGCSLSPVSIEFFNRNENSISIFPNPFSTQTTINVNGQLKMNNGEFVMYDVYGREVKKISIVNYPFSIQRDNLPSGVYFFRLTTSSPSLLLKEKGERVEVIATGKLVITD